MLVEVVDGRPHDRGDVAHLILETGSLGSARRASDVRSCSFGLVFGVDLVLRRSGLHLGVSCPAFRAGRTASHQRSIPSRL